MIYNVEVIVPAFTRGKQQLSMVEVETTRILSAERVHVERTISVARQKYSVVTIPISFLQDYVITGVITLDNVVRVACGLSNSPASIVPSS